MIMMSPVPQNCDVSSAADVHHIKLLILSCEFFFVFNEWKFERLSILSLRVHRVHGHDGNWNP